MAATVSSKVLCKGWGTLKEYCFSYARRNGEYTEVTREIYDRGHAVAVLLYDPDTDLVLLVRQFRPAAMVNKQDPFLLEACAGMLDSDDPENCVRREAFEESGVVVKELKFVSKAYAHPGAITEALSMYVGIYSSSSSRVGPGGGLAEEEEDIEVVEMKFEQAFAMIAAGDIVDMKTIILLQFLQLERGAPAPVLSS